MTGDAPAIRVWIGFGALCLGMFMAILDIQIVATSLPAIQAAIGIQPDEMSWIQTSYLIAEVIAIPLTGFLTRVFTTRGLFALAIVIFTASSVGCAASGGFASLVAWRVVQGFSGGVMIPAVFTAVFQLFPGRGQAAATTIAGVLAVLAPTLGPIAGGFITDTLSWRWLFLINVAPGIIALIVGWTMLPHDKTDLAHGRRLDVAGLVLLAVGLASLELGLKEAPKSGWIASSTLLWLVLALACLAFFVVHSLRRVLPVVELDVLRDRNFAVGCALSFVTGFGLYGMVYLMPVHLAFVRGHSAFEIGKIMLVTGLAQLAAAPLVVTLEKRVSAGWLTLFGFILFGAGLLMGLRQTPATDFEEMMVPQAIRGFGVMFCLLPPTRFALGYLPIERVPNASGLFNLMRNLGGAIGLALVDTIIFGRILEHAEYIANRLRAGNRAMAEFVGGLPLEKFTGQAFDGIDPEIEAKVAPLVEKAAVSMAIAEAWAMLGLVTLAGAALVLLARPVQPEQPSSLAD
jgi:MFS transporter, DHA2 family, multidrug resistance protein